MTKHTFIRKIRNRIDDATVSSVTLYLDTMIDIITETLINGEGVQLYGFGEFVPVDRPKRNSVITMGNRKGETYIVPASKGVKFKAHKGLKDALNGGEKE